MLPRRTPLLLMVASLLLAQLGCSGSEDTPPPSGATAAAASPEEPPEEPSEEPPPAPLHERMLGRWPMTFRTAVDAAPEAQRVNSMTMYYSACREEPTREELEAAGIPTAARVGIYLTRAKLAAGEDDERVTRLVHAIDQIRSRLPTFEFLPGNRSNVHTGGEVKPATYTIDSETPESITITLTEQNDTDGPETLVITMPSDDEMVLTDPTHEQPTVTLAREGTADPMNAPEVSPLPTGQDIPAGLVGRWKADGAHGIDVEFRPNRDYILHGSADIDGHFWVTEADGNNITIRTQVGPMPHQLADTIELVLDGDSLSWHNLGSDAHDQLTRQ